MSSSPITAAFRTRLACELAYVTVVKPPGPVIFESPSYFGQCVLRSASPPSSPLSLVSRAKPYASGDLELDWKPMNEQPWRSLPLAIGRDAVIYANSFLPRLFPLQTNCTVRRVYGDATAMPRRCHGARSNRRAESFPRDFSGSWETADNGVLNRSFRKALTCRWRTLSSRSDLFHLLAEAVFGSAGLIGYSLW